MLLKAELDAPVTVTNSPEPNSAFQAALAATLTPPSASGWTGGVFTLQTVVLHLASNIGHATAEQNTRDSQQKTAEHQHKRE